MRALKLKSSEERLADTIMYADAISNDAHQRDSIIREYHRIEDELKRQPDFSKFFFKRYFWDTDMSRLHLEWDKDFIIVRGLLGNEDSFEENISKLERFYSKNDIVQALRTTGELIDEKACFRLANRYGLEKFYPGELR